MACLIRRSNGFYYSVRFKRGKRIWVSLRTRDEAEARQAMQEQLEQLKPYDHATLDSFFGDFLRRSKLEYSEKTIVVYRQSYKNFRRICGNKRLAWIKPMDAEKFKEERCKEVSPTSVNIELKTLRAAFTRASKLQFIDANPFDATRKVRVPHKEASFLSEDELSLLLRTIDNTGLREIVTFAVQTMMRLGEIVSLRWENVDLKRKIIHIRSTEGFQVKGGKPRWTPMSPWVYQYLSRSLRKSGLVFEQGNGIPYKGNSVSHRFKKFVRKAGLPEEVHFHSLRHTGISWLINHGQPAAFVQKIAGHSSLAVTQIYTHLEDANLSNAMNAFGAFSWN